MLGGLYNGVDKPPAVDYVDASDGKVKLRRWTSAKGHEITISDYDDEDHIIIKTKDNEYGIAISKVERPDLREEQGQDRARRAGRDRDQGRRRHGVRRQDQARRATAALEMKGASAKLEGTGETEIKGSVVKLN